MADAGTSVGAGHEEQNSEHGKLFEASLGLGRISSRSSTSDILQIIAHNGLDATVF